MIALVPTKRCSTYPIVILCVRHFTPDPSPYDLSPGPFDTDRRQYLTLQFSGQSEYEEPSVRWGSTRNAHRYRSL